MHALAQLFQNDGNIILMGPPGAGKTSCAKQLAAKFGMDCFDIDDDLLEKVWNCTVGEKLRNVGDSKFVELEGEALLTLNIKKNTVIALTGSNPLHEESMLYLKPKGIIVYIDVPSEDILKRLEMMKVDRIVGQGTKSLSEILAYRKSFYEKYYDLRVLIPHNASLDDVTKLVAHDIESYITAKQTQSSRFSSTRSQDTDTDFFHVILKGLASDGGLYLPKSFPLFSPSELARLGEHTQNYCDFALRILERWIPELPPQVLRKMTEKAYQDFSPLVRNLNDNKYMLELFHGPTASFKDFALQLFPQIFSYIAKNDKYCILVSTSGDTGSATVSGFCKQTEIPVMVLFPSEGVSPVQKAQMVTADYEKLKVLGVQSDFDYCQSSLKEVFNDNEFTTKIKDQFGTSFSAANSINWGRLLPQVCYHMYSYLHLVNEGKIKIGEPIDLCVPTGNFGNILAGVLAKECGVNIRKFVCASNDNNVLTDFFKTGVYDIKERNLVKTDSPSIDILKSSNLERLLFVLDRKSPISKYFKEMDSKKEFQVENSLFSILKDNFYGSWCDNATAIKTIRSLYNTTKSNGTPVLIDPHTAVAVHVAEEYRKTTGDNIPLVIASTAHYAKFPSAILEALELEGKDESVQVQIKKIAEFVQNEKAEPSVHKDVLAACNSTTTRYAVIQPSMNVLKLTIQDFVSTLVQEKKL